VRGAQHVLVAQPGQPAVHKTGEAQTVVELPGVAAVLGPLAARRVRRGVDANLDALKRILEGSARDAESARP
jgi:hypothetical protein